MTEHRISIWLRRLLETISKCITDNNLIRAILVCISILVLASIQDIATYILIAGKRDIRQRLYLVISRHDSASWLTQLIKNWPLQHKAVLCVRESFIAVVLNWSGLGIHNFSRSLSHNQRLYNSNQDNLFPKKATVRVTTYAWPLSIKCWQNHGKGYCMSFRRGCQNKSLTSDG